MPDDTEQRDKSRHLEQQSRPHQFRTRNGPNKPQQTRSKTNESTAKSTNPIDILPLITVWLQVRVLPGPPLDQWISCLLFHNPSFTAPEMPRFVAAKGAPAVRKLLLWIQSGYDFSTRS
jgi:hypothetical protein